MRDKVEVVCVVKLVCHRGKKRLKRGFVPILKGRIFEVLKKFIGYRSVSYQALELLIYY